MVVEWNKKGEAKRDKRNPNLQFFADLRFFPRNSSISEAQILAENRRFFAETHLSHRVRPVEFLPRLGSPACSPLLSRRW